MINNKYKYIYTKVGKAGSSTIEKMLVRTSSLYDVKHIDHYHLLDDINKKTKDYFKFTFVRNPWDRAVSRFHYIQQKIQPRTKNYRHATFEEYILSKGAPYALDDERKFLLDYKWAKNSPNLQRIYQEMHPFENQLDWISDEQGNILTDFIGKLENLEEDYAFVCNKLKMEQSPILHNNKSKHKHYTKYYTSDAMIESVAEKYAKDIEYFKYKFEK